jgi:hypothetical protein
MGIQVEISTIGSQTGWLIHATYSTFRMTAYSKGAVSVDMNQLKRSTPMYSYGIARAAVAETAFEQLVSS